MIKGCALPQVFLLFDFPPRQRRATYDARSSRACNRTKTPLLLRWRNLRGTALCSQGTHILLGDLFVVMSAYGVCGRVKGGQVVPARMISSSCLTVRQAMLALSQCRLITVAPVLRVETREALPS